MILQALTTYFTLQNVCLALGGNIIGLIFGAIPGLTGSMALALFLPVSFIMPGYTGLIFLGSMYIGGTSGGLFGSILTGIPGTTASIATVYDGYPMTQKGEATKALGIAILSSAIGSVGGILVAMFFCPIISKVALLMGPWEYFSLCFCAIVLVVTISKDDMWNGLVAAFLGVILSCVGFSPIDGGKRFNFGIHLLLGGINTTCLMLGIFALSTVVVNYAKHKNVNPPVEPCNFKGLGVSLKEFIEKKVLIIRSFLVGVWIGFLPGMGPGLSNQVSYAMAKSASKEPETFGHGNPEGVYAAEVSNNASIGGAIIPMITLGIPGDTPTTLILSALIVFGLEPGPLLMRTSSDYVYLFFITLLLGAILSLTFSFCGLRVFPKILSIPYHYLYTGIVLFCFTGAYSLSNNIDSLMLCVFISLLGIFFSFSGLNRAPFLLGFILGPMLESNLRKGLTYTEYGFGYFFMRPASCVFLVIAILSLFWPFVREQLERKKAKPVAADMDDIEQE